MNSIYIESEKILARKDIVEWLDGCGATIKHLKNIIENTYIIFGVSKTNGIKYWKYNMFLAEVQSEGPMQCTTALGFCQGVAKILGIPEPTFGVDISKTETTTEPSEQLPPKGMAIEVSRLSEDDRRELCKIAKEEFDWDYYLHNQFIMGWDQDGWLWNKLPRLKKLGYTITDSPKVFMEYVAQQTGKEYVGEDLKPVQFFKYTEKPPLGLRPKYISDKERMQEIQEAIDRYKMANKRVPEEWLEEHLELNMAEFSISYPHKTYRILDSLDDIPLDKRFKLSEWIPPFQKDVVFIIKGKAFVGHIWKLQESIFALGGSNELIKDLDGEWMRIV